MDTDPFDPKSKFDLGAISPAAGKMNPQSWPQLSASLLIRPLWKRRAQGIHRPVSSAFDPVNSVRILNFEDGLCEAKQEAHYGNLAIFRSGQSFFEISWWIKTNSVSPL
jgi:hypothetical protein